MSFVFARTGDVVVEYADDPGANPTWVTIGCLVGDLNVTRSYATTTTEREDWCAHITPGADIQPVALEELTVEASGTIEMDPKTAAHAALNTAFKTNALIALRITANGATEKHQVVYEGKLTNHDLNFRGAAGQTSQVVFTFHANDRERNTSGPEVIAK